jgi:hypothetical protein
MNAERLLTMDPYILLSWANMKLRDEFSSLDILCDEYDISRETISGRLKRLGYEYNEQFNQFKPYGSGDF